MSSDNRDRLTFGHNLNGEFEYQLQIGSKLYPEYPIRSHNEAFYQLKKAFGVQASAVHNFDIPPLSLEIIISFLPLTPRRCLTLASLASTLGRVTS